MSILRQYRRPSSEAWWALLAFLVTYAFVVGSVVNHIGPASSTAAKVASVLLLLTYPVLSAILAYRAFIHARVEASEDGLLVANPFRGIQNVHWSEIVSMRADRLLVINCTNGRSVIAWVIQKNGWSRMKNIRKESDDVISEFGRLAGIALKTPAKDFFLI